MVYGSAPKLLEPGAQDLGVIASTRGLSTEIARQLTYHRDYTPHAAAATGSGWRVRRKPEVHRREPPAGARAGLGVSPTGNLNELTKAP